MTSKPQNPSIFALVRSLEEVKISYTMASVREGYIMITAAVPGERWEIEATEDGEIEIEIFTSTGDIYGPEKLDEFFRRFSD